MKYLQGVTTIQSEQRLTFRFLAYWNRIREGREFPALSDVNIGEIAEMWHHSFNVDVAAQENEHSFQYFGPELVNVFGTDYTNGWVKEALEDAPMLANTIGFYPRVLDSRAPVSESSSFYLEGREVKYRSLIVPLSSDGEQIDYLFGTTNYKVY